MNRALLLLSLGLVLALALRSPSVADLNAKYPVVPSYEARPGILMTPKYSADGQVCQMSIERQRGTRSGVMFDSFMSDKFVKEIVDELAPRSERGKPRPGREDVVAIVTTGGMTTNMTEYENIDFDVMDGPNGRGWSSYRGRIGGAKTNPSLPHFSSTRTSQWPAHDKRTYRTREITAKPLVR